MLETSYTLNLGQLINITLDMKKYMWNHFKESCMNS